MESQESSPTPQFKSINCSALNFLYGPTLTSTHDYWKNHSFDKTDLYVEYIMWNARLDETQAASKIARRNINNLINTDDTTFMEKSEEELKSLLMKVKEESEKAGLKLNIQIAKTMSSGPITSWQMEGEKVEAVTDFILGVSKITMMVTAATK